MGRSTVSFLVVVSTVMFGACGFKTKTEGPVGAGGAAGSSSNGGSFGTAGTFGRAGTFGYDGGFAGTNPQTDGPTGVSNPDANCGALNRGATKLPPDILIVLDASQSMNATADNTCMTNCGANSKWSQMAQALGQVVQATDTTVNWGLKFFADDAMCTVNPTMTVPIAAGTGAAITAAIAARTDAMGNVRNGSRTPTRSAELVATTYLGGLADPNPKFILLATDGLPNCIPGNTNVGTTDPAGTVAAVAAALTAGLPTFVVGVATSTDPNSDMTLTMAANAGGHPRAVTPPYYPVSSAADLVTAFADIVGIAATCTFQIGAAPNDRTSKDHIDVFGDDNKITYDTTHTDGWDYTDSTHTAVQVYGATCDAIKAGTIVTVTITFQCIIN